MAGGGMKPFLAFTVLNWFGVICELDEWIKHKADDNDLFIYCTMSSSDSPGFWNDCYICLNYFQLYDSNGLSVEHRTAPSPFTQRMSLFKA